MNARAQWHAQHSTRMTAGSRRRSRPDTPAVYGITLRWAVHNCTTIPVDVDNQGVSSAGRGESPANCHTRRMNDDERLTMAPGRNIPAADRDGTLKDSRGAKGACLDVRAPCTGAQHERELRASGR